MKDINSIPVNELGVGSPIKLEVLETQTDLDYVMAIIMLEAVIKNNKEGKQTMFILPVGPLGYAKRFAWLVNRNKVSLKNTIILNMDEYMWDEKTLMEPDHPLSFVRFMNSDFYGKIHDDLNVLPENRLFPDPNNLMYMWERIQEKEGGVDVAFGGIGLDGHIAFNEPPLEPISVEDFGNLHTRVLPIYYTTQVTNSLVYGGNYKGMPPFCITIGMREILSAQRLRFFTGVNERSASMLRQVLHGPVTSEVPASLMQTHPDCKIFCLEAALMNPII